MLLIANGFNEEEFTEIQRTLLKTGARLKTIAPENSLSNGWLGTGWGHYFPVDGSISDALGSDFDMMVVVGGARGVAKLQQNPHTARLLRHFLDAEKPLVVMNEAIGLLAQTERLESRNIAGDATDPALAASGARVMDQAPFVTDGALLTARTPGVADLVAATLDHLTTAQQLVAA